MHSDARFPWTGRGGRQRLKVPRHGFIEPMLFSAITYFVLSRPQSAPGPSNELLGREQAARQTVVDVQDALDQIPSPDNNARQQLEQALQRLQTLEEELQVAEMDLQEYPIPEYLRDACQAGVVNVAITGASGVGKSSWVNTIRKLKARDPGAAKTGTVETTLGPQMYKFPGPAGMVRRVLNRVGIAFRSATGQTRDDNPVQVGDRLMLQNCSDDFNGQTALVVSRMGDAEWQVELESGKLITVKPHQVTGVLAECAIWDLPGVGTPNYPQATYLRRMGIRHFDMVVLMTASRFTEAELMLVRELNKWQVPYFLVRNKVDADISSEVEKEEESGNGGESGIERRSQIEQRTLANIKHYLKSEFHLDDVYCVSAKMKFRSVFDFPKLERDMEVVLKRQRGATKL